MVKKIVFGLFSLGMCFLLSFQLPDKDVKKIYVAPQGKDSNDGSLQKPLASLETAQQAVRVAKQSGFKGSIEVIVRGGTYFLEETLEFTAEDSGTKSAPIIWKASAGEKVILSGGKRIKGNWKKGNDGIWFVAVPEARSWKRNEKEAEKYAKRPEMPLNFRELFVNGKRSIRARYPNAHLENPFLYSVANTKNEVQIPEGKIKKSWGTEPDAQINLVPRWRFFNQWNDVTAVDIEKSVIKVGPREQHGEIDKGSWFWIEGVKEELDMPGEWYLSHEEGKLYYKPLQGTSPNDSEIIFPYLNRIFYLKGDIEKGIAVNNIQFQGFDFRHTTFTLGQIEARVHTDCAVLFENTQYCSMTDCHFENIGGYALWLHLDSRNNVFDNNTVKNSGGGGVLMTGARLSYMDDTKIYTPGEKASKVFPILNRITRNTVEQCGKIRYYGGGVHIDSRPASMAMEAGNYIAHNHFSDLSRNGIFLFRNQGGNVVEFNEIHDCMQTTIDGAAIHFATMNRLAAPNYIMNNYLYDIW
ncbi:MAG: right-handed parallel beta-helix repeat-containing protein, partial [bacterium]